jgi:hypothetical protein
MKRLINYGIFILLLGGIFLGIVYFKFTGNVIMQGHSIGVDIQEVEESKLPIPEGFAPLYSVLGAAGTIFVLVALFFILYVKLWRDNTPELKTGEVFEKEIIVDPSQEI